MSSVSSLNSLLASSTPTSSSASSSINLSSILSAATGATSTGIDVSSAVDAAIYAARAPERQWQAQQATLQAQTSALNSLQTAVQTLTSDLNSLNDPTGAIASKTAVSSDAAIVTASASSTAVPGTHIITVQNMATTSSWYSSPLTSSGVPTGSSTLQITLANGQQASFTLGASGTNSLTALASTINASSLGVSASVINDASGARLALVGQSTGTANAFDVTEVPSAAGSSWSSAQVASSSTQVAAGTYQLNDGANNTSFTVAQGATLSDVSKQINALGLNVTASIATSSSGASLQLTAVNGGSVSMSADPALAMKESNTAKDASLTVDGIPVTSSSNTVTGAIGGVTLNLQGSVAGMPVSLNVAPDTTRITSLVSQFVTDYNSATSMVNSQFSLSSGSGTQGVLGSDPTVRSLQSALLGLTAYHPATGNSQVGSLASLGISVNDDGTLSLDTAQLSDALQTNSQGVQQLLQGSALNGFASAANKQLKVFSDPASGVLNVNLKNIARQYSTLQSEINDFESGYIASQTTVLTSMYSKAEIALQQLPAQLKQLQAQLSNNSNG